MLVFGMRPALSKCKMPLLNWIDSKPSLVSVEELGEIGRLSYLGSYILPNVCMPVGVSSYVEKT